ncbi:MAG: pitrilysin family protein [Candidatus Parcubacteria bacterium]|nr:pitrilysin family protein [Candidatus Parcubacteria bacterium]
MYFLDKLSHGPTLITVPVKNTQAVTILVFVKVGSRYENKKINGAAHFIEHMMFKGTKKRPTNLLIARELDALGAEYNAFTAKDITAYWIKLDKKFLPLGLEIISDMLFHSLFDPKEFAREKGVIIEEIKMYEDNPLIYIDKLFEQTLYGDCPLGWLISGEIKNIRHLTHRDLLNFKKRYYSLSNMIVAIAGQVNCSKTRKMINQYFCQPSQINRGLPFKKYISRPQKKSNLKILSKPSQQIQLALGFPAYSYTHRDLEILNLLSIILGGNMSSRLFTEVREKRGLVYSIRAESTAYQDTGNFVITVGVDAKNVPEAVQVILSELKKIKKDGVTAEELKRAKTFFEGKLSLSLEDSADLAAWYGHQQALIGKILTPAGKVKQIKKINLMAIKRVANDIFQGRKLNLAAIGAFKKSPRLLSLLNKGL